ncbi:hypothetical protein H0H93_010572 [Arthromyces matolae]|nr:hypothetical protein H0H93_010572 [Arthromyces matolae]
MSSPPGSLSPLKRRHNTLLVASTSTDPPSKRARTTDAPEIEQPIENSESGSTAIIYAFQNPNDTDEGRDDKVVALSSTEGLGLITGMNCSFSEMDTEGHAQRVTTREAMKVGTGTEIAYPRHIKNYVEFMTVDQARRKTENPNWTIVPPFPITARNVAIFLNMETKRMSKSSDGQSIPGTRLGVSAIKQCISALESWRRTHEHEYPNNPEALRPLRLDSRIRTHETNAGATESERNAEAQITKALGSTADTYTEQELIRASVWCLRVEGTDQQVHLALRDRAMILMTTSTAFRGDNIRSLLLSDLYSQAVRLIEAGLDATAMALVLFSDQGKTNKTGRIDEQAAFRHRHPELCSFELNK